MNWARRSASNVSVLSRYGQNRIEALPWLEMPEHLYTPAPNAKLEVSVPTV